MFDAYIDGFRGTANAAMTLSLAAYSPTGESTTDADGYEIPEYAFEGTVAGKVQGGSQSNSDTATRYVNIGGVERPVIEGGLHIPVDAFVFEGLMIQASEQRGQAWEFEVETVGAGDDGALRGRRYMVVKAPVKSKATARRLDVVEL